MTWLPDEAARREFRRQIPVPPKYTSADFAKGSYWRHRGKLDVPKERFISYPGDPDHAGKRRTNRPSATQTRLGE